MKRGVVVMYDVHVLCELLRRKFQRGVSQFFYCDIRLNTHHKR